MRILILCTLFLLSSSVIIAADDKTIDAYLEQLQSPSVFQRTEAAKRITGEMISERRLFDRINQMLLNSYLLESPSEAHIDEMAWLCKALASSGRPEYRGTLQQVAGFAASSKLKHYARQSLDLIEDYSARNALIDQADVSDPELSREENNYVKMLLSQRWDLQRDAAKRIFRAGQLHPRVYSAVNEALLRGAENQEWDNLSIDAMAWMCKALGASGRTEYRETLEKISAYEGNFKLQSHARKALAMLQ